MGAAGSIECMVGDNAELLNINSDEMRIMATEKFKEFDKDKNGYIENDELVKVTEWVMSHFGERLGTDPDVVRSKLLVRLDANGDGKLDIDEFVTLFKTILLRVKVEERAKSKFLEFDTDKSGYLELKEVNEVITWTLGTFPVDDNVKKYREQLLRRIDQNGDGKLDLQEFQTLFDDMLIRSELMGRAKVKFDELDEDKSGMIEKGELDKVAEWALQVYAEKSVVERASFKVTLMNKIDLNGDGKLSLQEFTVFFDEVLQRMDLIDKAKKAFTKLDTDHSGYLEKNELSVMLTNWSQIVVSDLQIDTTLDLKELMTKFDGNDDGKISLMEFVPLFDDCVAKSGIWKKTEIMSS